MPTATGARQADRRRSCRRSGSGGHSLLTGGWYVAQWYAREGPLALARLLYVGGQCGRHSDWVRYYVLLRRELPGGPVSGESTGAHRPHAARARWIHQDVLRALTPVAKTPQVVVARLAAGSRGARAAPTGICGGPGRQPG